MKKNLNSGSQQFHQVAFVVKSQSNLCLGDTDWLKVGGILHPLL